MLRAERELGNENGQFSRSVWQFPRPRTHVAAPQSYGLRRDVRLLQSFWEERFIWRTYRNIMQYDIARHISRSPNLIIF